MNFIHYLYSIAVRNDPEQETFPSGITLKGTLFTVFLCLFTGFQLGHAELTIDLPSPDSFTLIQQAIEGKDSRSLFLAYRALPQMKRKDVPDLVLRIFQDASSTELQRALIDGIGKSGNLAYSDILLKNFVEAKPEVKQSIAEALGNLKEAKAMELFTPYLRDRRNWYTTPLTTEAVIIATGKISSIETVDSLFQPLLREMPDPKFMAIEFSRDASKDRLAGAIAWAYGDLARSENEKSTPQKNFIQGLFVAKSQRSSIAAAKTLFQLGDPAGEIYLTGLMNNSNVLISLRILCAKALASTRGEKAFASFNAAGSENPQILLAMVQELRIQEIPYPKALELVSKNDDGLTIEGALALAQAKKKEALETVIKRSQEKSVNLVTKAILDYAWEEAASL